MPKQLNRYNNQTIIEHLANQYVLGLLTTKTRMRVEKLSNTNQALEEKIIYWQQRFSHFDTQTAELAPKAQTWQHIEEKLNPVEKNETKTTIRKSFWSWLALPKLATAMAIITITVLSYFVFKPFNADDPLSYVAVLTDKNQQAQLVASTYGESKKLIINVINSPKINNNQDLEIWVISKTDLQARSLGIIPRKTPLIQKQLNNAQWRLIKDSDSLIVTVEDRGGSPIGEPSELIVSRGLYVHLKNNINKRGY
ncbi:MAG: anti-sigma factor [Alteromonadaceae bacterium]|nr:anti-sigma factor [Alteromonadaceae bacterium]